MKCPKMYKVVQQNIRKPIVDIDNNVKGEYHILIETQEFNECYQENCVAWDREKKVCRKVEME